MFAHCNNSPVFVQPRECNSSCDVFSSDWQPNECKNLVNMINVIWSWLWIFNRHQKRFLWIGAQKGTILILEICVNVIALPTWTDSKAAAVLRAQVKNSFCQNVMAGRVDKLMSGSHSVLRIHYLLLDCVIQGEICQRCFSLLESLCSVGVASVGCIECFWKGVSIRVGLCSSVLPVCGCVSCVCVYMQRIKTSETLQHTEFGCVCIFACALCDSSNAHNWHLDGEWGNFPPCSVPPKPSRQTEVMGIERERNELNIQVDAAPGWWMMPI